MRKIKIKTIAVALPVLILLTIGIVFFVNPAPEPREEVVISIPYSEHIRNIDTNYYKLWLEEQTGLSITFNILYDTPTAEYLRSMFTSGYVQSDAFFSLFSGEDWDEWNTVLQEFGEKGYIVSLNDYIDQSTYLDAIFNDFTGYDLRSVMTSPDGNIYYMPGFDPSISESHFQVLWLNQSWLRMLNQKIPHTTDDLRVVLAAFKEQNPDVIPLAGSRDVPSEQVYNFLINAFIYNDHANSRLFIENGSVRFAPMMDGWREAMKYLNELYADGLITPFTYEHSVFAGLANSPWNILGGFASQSITDVLFQGNYDLINDFTHRAPLIGPEGIRNATVKTPLPRPAGVITASCANPEAVFKLFDLMLSEAAFLIGRYGEEGVDWVRGNQTDIDTYGNKATVRVINQLWDKTQNKHLDELGPFFAYPKYADGVTFSGFQADQEYVDARAYRVYESYKPGEYIKFLHFAGRSDIQTLRRLVDAYTEESIEAFITGVDDPFDDEAWEAHLQRYRELGIDRLISAATEVLP
jgi:putative aldouronate transport system substrate-binding protein